MRGEMKEKEIECSSGGRVFLSTRNYYSFDTKALVVPALIIGIPIAILAVILSVDLFVSLSNG